MMHKTPPQQLELPSKKDRVTDRHLKHVLKLKLALTKDNKKQKLKKDYTEMVKGFRTAGYNLTPVRPYTQICTLAYTNPCFHFIFLATKNSFIINSLIAEQ